MIRGQRGHGLPDASPRLSCSSGGAGKSSKLMRLLQPCRSDVPMQSVPVSPPPMTTTCLPFAEMKPPPYLEVSPTSGVASVVSSAGGLAKSAFWLRVRNSIAYTIPSRSRPGMGRLFGTVDPMARTVASNPSTVSLMAAASTSAPVTKEIPSASIRSTLRCTVSLSSFMFGMPARGRGPGRVQDKSRKGLIRASCLGRRR
mmetsp:Transcript_11762/g.38725  ORF Transcript_11762/g.38725 Transcript_11762/m.38725 type:complete len:200 (+) Transcript_11762:257-856(+)